MPIFTESFAFCVTRWKNIEKRDKPKIIIHYNVIYNKPTRCNSGSIVFIKNYKYAVHVSDALCGEHCTIPWPKVLPWNSTVLTDLHIYTGFIPTQFMTNTSGCC